MEAGTCTGPDLDHRLQMSRLALAESVHRSND